MKACEKAGRATEPRPGGKVRTARAPRKPQKLKGQLVFEFIIAVVIFFGIIFYVLNYLGTNVSGYREGFGSDSMRAESFKIGEMLIMNKGNWSGRTPSVVGLAVDWPILNSTKMTWLQTYCNTNKANYEDLKRKFGLGEGRYFGIQIDEINASNGSVIRSLLSCPQDDFTCTCKIPTEIRRQETKRYGILDNRGSLVYVYVHVW